MSIRNVPFQSLILAAIFAVIVGTGGCSAGANIAGTSIQQSDQRSDNLSVLMMQQAEQVYEHAHPGASFLRNSVSGPWVKIQPVPGMPGYARLPDGEIILLPSVGGFKNPVVPLVLGGSPSPSPSPPPTKDVCPSLPPWNGIGPPPYCDNNGAFRRAYSNNSGYFGVAGNIGLPTVGPSPLPPPNVQSQPYVFYEAWPLTQPIAQAEVGLIYSSAHNNYTPYISTPDAYWADTNRFTAGQVVSVAVWAGMLCCLAGNLTPAMEMYIIGSTTSNPGYPTFDCCGPNPPAAASNYGATNCCIWARMTAIAQAKQNAFEDGMIFGPVSWQLQTVCNYPVGCYRPVYPDFYWPLGGYQSWPNDPSKIIVNFIDSGDESVTINLHT